MKRKFTVKASVRAKGNRIFAATASRMFVQEDNGGRGILLNVGREWSYNDCSPNGTYGDVDILSGSIESVASRIRKAIQNGEVYGPNDFGIDDLDDYGFRAIPEYRGMTIAEIDEYENNGRDFDMTSYAEI